MSKISDSPKAKFKFVFASFFPCIIVGEIFYRAGYEISGRIASILTMVYLSLIFLNWEEKHLRNFKIAMFIIAILSIFLLWYSMRLNGAIDGRTATPIGMLYFVFSFTFVHFMLKWQEK